MIGTPEYLLIAWFALCAVALVFIFMFTKVPKKQTPKDWPLTTAYINGFMAGMKCNDDFHRLIAKNEAKKQTLNKNTVEVIDVRNEFATIEFCVKDFIDDLKLTKRLVMNEISPNPCIAQSDDVIRIKKSFLALNEKIERAIDAINRLNAKREGGQR